MPGDGLLDLSSVAEALGRPWVGAGGVYALGPESGRALQYAVAPDLTLPD